MMSIAITRRFGRPFGMGATPGITLAYETSPFALDPDLLAARAALDASASVLGHTIGWVQLNNLLGALSIGQANTIAADGSMVPQIRDELKARTATLNAEFSAVNTPQPQTPAPSTPGPSTPDPADEPPITGVLDQIKASWDNLSTPIKIGAVAVAGYAVMNVFGGETKKRR